MAIVGYDMAEQLFGKRHILGETLTLNGLPYTVVGKIRKKDQDSNYNGPDNNKIFVPFAAMMRDMPRTRRAARHRCRDIIVAPKDRGRGRPADACSTSAPAGSRTSTGRSSRTSARSSPAATASIPPTSEAVAMWDTSLETLMFGRMIDSMKRLLHHRRRRHAGARRHRRDEHHADRGARSGRARSASARRSARRRAASSGSSSWKASS